MAPTDDNFGNSYHSQSKLQNRTVTIFKNLYFKSIIVIKGGIVYVYVT